MDKRHAHDQPRLIAWEVTKRCPLNCRHCRASSSDREFADELTRDECFRVLENIASFAKPIIILTGGEPMARKDIYEITEYGTGLGLRMVMAPCGLLMDHENTRKMKESGIMRISLSIDGVDRKTHDAFRQIDGALDAVINAARIARETGLEFQINSTITKLNYRQIEGMLQLAIDLGAVGFHPFLLVPTGRGSDLADYEIEPREYENLLTWIYEKSLEVPIQLKPTCAPHYYRIFRQKEKQKGRKVTVETHGLSAMTKGCLGGQSFAFISNTGRVQICGFLEETAGDVRTQSYDFRTIWETSPLFLEMRNLDGYHGRCGVCEYRRVCGGCRARAFATTGDYLDEEPYCVYQPRASAPSVSGN